MNNKDRPDDDNNNFDSIDNVSLDGPTERTPMLSAAELERRRRLREDEILRRLPPDSSHSPGNASDVLVCRVKRCAGMASRICNGTCGRHFCQRYRLGLENIPRETAPHSSSNGINFAEEGARPKTYTPRHMTSSSSSSDDGSRNTCCKAPLCNNMSRHGLCNDCESYLDQQRSSPKRGSVKKQCLYKKCKNLTAERNQLCRKCSTAFKERHIRDVPLTPRQNPQGTHNPLSTTATRSPQSHCSNMAIPHCATCRCKPQETVFPGDESPRTGREYDDMLFSQQRAPTHRSRRMNQENSPTHTRRPMKGLAESYHPHRPIDRGKQEGQNGTSPPNSNFRLLDEEPVSQATEESWSLMGDPPVREHLGCQRCSCQQLPNKSIKRTVQEGMASRHDPRSQDNTSSSHHQYKELRNENQDMLSPGSSPPGSIMVVSDPEATSLASEAGNNMQHTPSSFPLSSVVSYTIPNKCKTRGCQNYGNDTCNGYCNECYTMRHKSARKHHR